MSTSGSFSFFSGGDNGDGGWVCIHPDGTRTPIWNVQWATHETQPMRSFQRVPPGVVQVVHQVAEPDYVTWWNGSSCSMSWEADWDKVPQI